jgi:hypothetical protein
VNQFLVIKGGKREGEREVTVKYRKIKNMFLKSYLQV